ncbi:hypothetical protein [Kitasatospora cineracea]|uniref:hypothetical protein n=1 Tax=Kitasatospora cineracea TaxID=88074 RepID=UPI0037A006C8
MNTNRYNNPRLRRLIGRTGLSGGQFAEEVNAVAAENGVRLHYQRASVSQWLHGTRPRPPAPAFIAEALSRRLGGPVTLHEAGLADEGGEPVTVHGAGSGADPSVLLQQDAVYVLTDDSDTAAGPSYAATLPRPRDGAAPRVSRAEVGCVRELTAHLSRSDHLSGSASALPSLRSFTTAVALPMLRRASAPAVHRSLMSACSHLVGLGGFLHMDQGHHGQAQRWYRLAAGLARESGDLAAAAVFTRSLSVQAHALGHHPRALALARAAADLCDHGEARLRAHVEGQLAVTLAANGEGPAALRAIHGAERALARCAGPLPVLGAYNQAALAYQRAEVRHCLGDVRGALEDLRLAARLRPESERRSQALVLARTGELNLAAGRLDEACVAWERFLELRRGLGSRRVDEAHRAMRAGLSPHRRDPFVSHLLAPSL